MQKRRFFKIEINPFITTQHIPQSILWKSFEVELIYHFELILPFKAIIEKYRVGEKRRDTYLKVCAVVLKNQKTTGCELIKEDLVTIGFPIETMKKALEYDTTYTFRNQLNDKVNIRLKFIKRNKKFMNIIEAEMLEPAAEHLAFASINYSEAKSYQQQQEKVIVRNSEDL